MGEYAYRVNWEIKLDDVGEFAPIDDLVAAVSGINLETLEETERIAVQLLLEKASGGHTQP